MEFKPLRPMNSRRGPEQLIAVILGLLICMPFFFGLVYVTLLTTVPNFDRYVFAIIGGSLAGVLIPFTLMYWYTGRRPTRRDLLLITACLVGGIPLVWSSDWLVRVSGLAIFLTYIVWSRFNRFPPHYLAAYRKLQAGATNEALLIANQAIQASPERWEPYQLRSLVHARLQRAVNAEQDARRAIQLKPKEHLAYGALGSALVMQSRFQEAKTAFFEALRLAPRYAMNHHNLGMAHYRLGEYQQAVDELEVAITGGRVGFDSQYLLATYWLAQSLEVLGRTQEAYSKYQQLWRYRNGLEQLRQDVRELSNTAIGSVMRSDVENIARRLNERWPSD